MQKSLIRSAALSCAAGLTLAACSTGGSSAHGGFSGSFTTGPGVDITHKTITLGILSPLSGVAELIGKPLTSGQEDYFRYLNAQGGIDGWKIKLDVKDDQYNPQLHVQEYNQMVGNVAMIGQSLGSPTTAAIERSAQQAGVVIGTAAQSSSFVSHSVNAVIGTPYAIDVSNAMYYLTQKVGTAAKVGIIYQNDDYGADGLRGFTAAQAAYHFSDAGQASYNVTDSSFTSQALAMKNDGAQYVVLTAIPSVAAGIIGSAAAIGYHPQWILQGPAWSEYLISSTGTSSGKLTPVAKVIAGAWVVGFTAAWGDGSVPGMARFLAVRTQYDPSQAPDGYYMYGYCLAEMERALLAKAIKARDLSRAGILNAKEHLGQVDFGGLIPSAIYTPVNGPADRQTDIAVVDLNAIGYLRIIAPYMEGPVAESMTFAG